jgi:hypothetical protein
MQVQRPKIRIGPEPEPHQAYSVGVSECFSPARFQLILLFGVILQRRSSPSPRLGSNARRFDQFRHTTAAQRRLLGATCTYTSSKHRSDSDRKARQQVALVLLLIVTGVFPFPLCMMRESQDDFDCIYVPGSNGMKVTP